MKTGMIRGWEIGAEQHCHGGILHVRVVNIVQGRICR